MNRRPAHTVERSARPPSLSLVMIVRNEETNLLRCLASAAPWVDEIVVCDTGSTDKTIEIARSFGARVCHFTWIDDFAAARNAALDNATGDWVLSLDADEALAQDTAPRLRELIARPHPAARPRIYLLRVRHHLDAADESDRVEQNVTRLFRRHPRLRWAGPIHEHLAWVADDGATPVKAGAAAGPEWVVAANVVIDHTGHTSADRVARQKDDRNIRILERAMAAEPAEGHYSFKLAQHYLERGDAAAALEYVQRALTLAAAGGAAQRHADWLPQAYVVLAGAQVLAAQLDAAAAAGREGTAAFPDHAGLWYQLGTIQLLREHLDEAERCFDRALALHGKPTRYSLNVGMTTWRPLHGQGTARALRGDHASALECYARALRSAPRNGEVVLAAARALGHAGRWAEAEAALSVFLAGKQQPESLGRREDEALALLAECLLAQSDERAQEAYEWLAAAVQTQPALHAARLRLGRLLCDAAAPAAAVEVLAPALDDPAAPAELYECLATALRSLHLEEDALNATAMAQAKRATRWPPGL